MKNIYMKFESLTAFERYLSAGKTQKGFSENSHSESDTSWAGTPSYEDANCKLLHGDKEASEKVEPVTDVMRSTIKLNKNRRQIHSDVVGFAANVPNFLAGVPQTMYNVRTIRVKHKVVNVVYNMSVNGGVSGESMFNAALKLFGAVLSAEADGVRVNLYVCDVADVDSQQIGWLLRIKSSSQHIDVLKMCYPLINPSMLRRHSFRFTEITEGVSKAFASGYGRASRDVSKMMQTLHFDRTDNCRVFSHADLVGKEGKEIKRIILTGK